MDVALTISVSKRRITTTSPSSFGALIFSTGTVLPPDLIRPVLGLMGTEFARVALARSGLLKTGSSRAVSWPFVAPFLDGEAGTEVVVTSVTSSVDTVSSTVTVATVSTFVSRTDALATDPDMVD